MGEETSGVLTVVISSGLVLLGSLKMGFGSVPVVSGFLRPMGASSSLLTIVYLPLSRAIASDEVLKRLSGKTTLGSPLRAVSSHIYIRIVSSSWRNLPGGPMQDSEKTGNEE